MAPQEVANSQQASILFWGHRCLQCLMFRCSDTRGILMQGPRPSVAYLQLPLWGAAKTRHPATLYAPTILTRCGCLQTCCLISHAYYYIASVMQHPMLVDADCDTSSVSSDAFASLCVTLHQNIFARQDRSLAVLFRT